MSNGDVTNHVAWKGPGTLQAAPALSDRPEPKDSSLEEFLETWQADGRKYNKRSGMTVIVPYRVRPREQRFQVSEMDMPAGQNVQPRSPYFAS